MTVLELGSDIAGSIRVPSNWCGICGHKPSWGVVPQGGHLPPVPGTIGDTDLNVVGPMARDVDELEMALDILAGADGHRATGWRLELPAARAKALSELRLAVWLDDQAYPVEDDVRPPMALPDVVGLHMELLYPLMERSSKLLHRDWLSTNEKREQLRAKIADFFREVDALFMPVAVVPAIAHDHDEPLARRKIHTGGGTRPYLDMFGWVGLATVAYLPATVVPVGRTTLAVARCVEELVGGFVPPPGC